MEKFILYVRLFREVVLTSVLVIKLIKLIHDFVIPSLNYVSKCFEKLFKQNSIRRRQVCIRTSSFV